MRPLAVAAGLAILLLVAADYSAGRPTPEDTVLLQFGGSPSGIPHVGYIAPHSGNLLYLNVTGHTPGQGDGGTTLAVVRQDGGVACAITVPCTLDDGEHVPADGGVVECDAPLDAREHVDFEPTSDCNGPPPTVWMQATFYYN